MDLRQLRYFIVIAEQGNFARAAEYLGVTQSALTQSIGKLEEGLGTRLFDRGRRGAVLTKAGSMLLPRAQLMTAEANCAVAEMRRLGTGSEGGVTIGMGKAIAPELILRAISDVIGDGNVPISIVEGCSPDLFDKLSRGQVDFVVSAPLPHLVASAELHQHRLYDMTEAVVVGPTHPLARADNVDLVDLMDIVWLNPPEGHGRMRHMQQVYQKAGLEPPWRLIRTDAIGLGIELLRQGMVVAHVVVDTFEDVMQQHGFRVLDVPALTLKRPVFLTQRKRSRLQGTALRMANRISQLAAQQPVKPTLLAVA